ncbi:DUF4919 domain-containing protein [Shewanella avicenniae]|uniref:DUF4919 domain-containing protein n=1 Tax=Shewanella avicenniae TaxID=2814294 RepID=A0ABX7QS56_9GAMM|nr:DUF4919 domain-containing protein [Shewanella avicenniae]QSX33533.1 DUF4919 domain-containing protein [Shewanella avicenniae]
MKSLLMLVTIMLLTACTGITHSPSQQAVNWADDVSFDAMRITVGWADDYQQRCHDQRPLGKIYDLADAGDWQQLASVGEQWLQQCPIDIRIHYMTSMALEQINDQAGADDHYRWFEGLMQSLVASGDGSTPQTAYVTVSVQEEYDAMYFFQVRPTQQRLIRDPLCDEVQVVDSKGDEMVLYFNPSAHFNRLSKKHAQQ